jgi:hypothetical protein
MTKGVVTPNHNHGKLHNHKNHCFFILHPLLIRDKIIDSINKNKMKKQKISSTLYSWIKDAGLKSAVFFLILAGGIYAYAQISWPAANPNPVTGVVGMFVGATTQTYDAPADYSTVNNLCANNVTDPNLAGSHVCTPDEMMNSYNHGTSQALVNTFFASTGKATLWINSGPPGFAANANDCKGWTKIDSPSANRNFGRVWNFQDKYGNLLDCTTGKSFACCK